MNDLHERSRKLLYSDQSSISEEWLERDNCCEWSFTTHNKNAFQQYELNEWMSTKFMWTLKS